MMIYFKIALRGWRKHPWTQSFSVIAFGVLLFLSTFFYWAYQSIHPVTKQLYEDQVLTVFLKQNLSVEAEKEVVDTLQSVMSSSQKKIESEFVEPEKFIHKLGVQYPELANELQSLGQDMNVLIPRFISLSGSLEQGAIEKIKAIPQVESIESSLGRYQPVLMALQSFQRGLLVFLFGLVLTFVTVLLLNAKMNQSLFIETINILKWMGANTVTLKFPAVISSVISGVLGAFLSILLWWLFSAEWIKLLQVLSPFFAQLKPPSLITISMVSLSVGLFLGVSLGVFQSSYGRKK